MAYRTSVNVHDGQVHVGAGEVILWSLYGNLMFDESIDALSCYAVTVPLSKSIYREHA